jgi:hypothetical protein
VIENVDSDEQINFFEAVLNEITLWSIQKRVNPIYDGFFEHVIFQPEIFFSNLPNVLKT